MAFVKTRKSRLLVGCILGVGLAFLLLWSSASVWGQEPGGRPVNLDVILLIDNSTSMSRGTWETGAPPSDPEGLRIQAAKFLVDYLRANAETLEANYRVGVVSFGGKVSDVISLRLLQDDTVRDSIRLEQIDSTDFGGPLQFALQEFRAKSFGAGNKLAVILFTDGRPKLPGTLLMAEQELLEYFEDLTPLIDELQEGGASLFLLGIGDAQEDRANWTQLIPEDHYTPITNTTELAGVYRHIVADLIGVAVSEGETLPAGRAEIIEIEPYLERVVFSFMRSDPAADVTLISPASDVLTPTIDAADIHHSIYSITSPDAGEWTVLWEGEGQVQYWVDKQYPLVRVALARPVSLVGQPITITASLVRDDEIVVDSDLDLEAEITLPNGDTVIQALSPIDGGGYTGSYKDVEAQGIYTVTAKATIADLPLSVRPIPVAIEIFPLPPLPTPPPQPTSTPTPKAPPTATPTVAPAVTPTATPAIELGQTTMIIGAILMLILAVVGIAWYVYNAYKWRELSKREKNLSDKEEALYERWEESFERKLDKTVDKLKQATSRKRIERILGEIEQTVQVLKYSPLPFAVGILRFFDIKDVDHAEQELQVYARGKNNEKKNAAGIAVFNLLAREETPGILPALYNFIGLGCDSEVLQYAQLGDIHDVPDLPDFEDAGGRQKLDTRDLCRIYSGLLSGDDLRLPRLLAEAEEVFERYGASDILAFHRCIRDSGDLRKEQDVIPIAVPLQLIESTFSEIPQLRPLKDILVQFEGIELSPLRTKDKGGFLDMLEKAQQQLSKLAKEMALPEWRMMVNLFESWRDFIGRELSREETEAKLVVKPVTKWFPNNVGLGDVHVAWVLHNEGPGLIEIEQVALYLGERELGYDTEREVLLCDEERCVDFSLSELAGAELSTGLDLEIAVSLNDMWKRRTERFDKPPFCHPHVGFSAPEIFRRDIEEGLFDRHGELDAIPAKVFQSSDALRQYCLETNLCVHCNQLALLQLLEYSGGDPVFVYALIKGLTEYLNDDAKWERGQPRYVTCADIPAIVEYIVDLDAQDRIAKAWSTFELDEQAVVKALLKSMALQGDEPASEDEIQATLGVEKSIAPVIERLETKGILKERDGRYRLRAKLIEEWHRVRQEREQALESVDLAEN